MFTLLMHFIKKTFLNFINLVQKSKLQKSIQELSVKINKTAKIHPHLHYYSSNIYLILSILHISQTNKTKALEYCNMSIFHDPQYNIAHTLKNLISSNEKIQKTQLKQLVLDSIIPKRLVTNLDHVQIFSKNRDKDNLYYKANRHLHDNKIDDAINNLKKYIKIHPNNLSALCDLGRAFLHQKQYKEAIKYLKKSISPTHKNFTSCLWLGTAYFLLNDFKKAKTYLLKALQAIDSEHKQYHKEFSKQFFERANTYYKLHEIELSLNDLHKSLDLHRSNMDSLLLRSQISISKTNLLDASLDLEKIEEKHPKNKKAQKLKHDFKKLQKELQHLS